MCFKKCYSLKIPCPNFTNSTSSLIFILRFYLVSDAPLEQNPIRKPISPETLKKRWPLEEKIKIPKSEKKLVTRELQSRENKESHVADQ